MKETMQSKGGKARAAKMTKSERAEAASKAAKVRWAVPRAPKRPGYDKLWLFFGLSRANFIVLPRVLLHEMPDKWQGKFAKMLQEFSNEFPGLKEPNYQVMDGKEGEWNEATRENEIVLVPVADNLTNYHHPNRLWLGAIKKK